MPMRGHLLSESLDSVFEELHDFVDHINLRVGECGWL